jgi:phosphonate degradation associated HDIG domain protein
VRRFPAVNPDGLRGALHSPAELVVNPPAAVAGLQQYLAEAHGVTLRLGVAVVGIDMPRVHAAGGEVWHADRVFVCSGADFETLFPEVFASAGLRRCKLQMMKTRPQPGGWQLGPHLAGGLTLCHYRAFEACPSVAALRARFAAEMPDYPRYGIHVMASQNDRGEVVIGDSHEYDADISPFDKAEIDELILGYLRRIARLPDWSIAARWNGVYAKHPTKPIVHAEPQPGCVISAATGGAGMTLAFGLARDWWDSRGSTTSTGVLNRIERLFADRGSREYQGEAVSQLEHALQCAMYAERDGCPGEVIAAALLHDIGHLLSVSGEDCAARGIDNRHEDLGVRFLEGAFGPAVTEPVRLHVAAKRYLAAARPGYVGLLSQSAVTSLHFQGGPMSPDEARAFEAHPHYEVAVKLREYDDRAKVVGLATPPFAHFRKYLETAARAGF